MSSNDQQAKYKRILLKVSGEMLSGDQGYGINIALLQAFAKNILPLYQSGIQIIFVIGAGNICRGKEYVKSGFDQVNADHMGMIATVFNGLAMRDVFAQVGMKSHVRSALPVGGVVEQYRRYEARHLLDKGEMVICVGGTGNPLVTTDSASALRAIELQADVLLKATKVDGVYSADPMQDPAATLFDKLTYDEVINKQLNVMDMAAFCLCRDYDMPIRVFNMNKENIYKTVVSDETEGTLIHLGD